MTQGHDSLPHEQTSDHDNHGTFNEDAATLCAISQRDNVAKELLDSEKTFVSQMATLVSVYIKPLKFWALELQANFGKGSMHPVLPEMFTGEIFANVEQLLVFNQHIVEEFSKIYDTTKAFGGFFKKAAPFFKMYSSYVSNYDRAMDTLTNLMETRLDFASFTRACELQEGCKGLNLRAYLIMPVQRIPRYKLLLTELLKHTPEHHPDYQDLVAAVGLVSSVVNSINEDIKRQERRFKVMEVQDRFATPLVTASRVHVMEGELIKMCRKGPKQFTFVLFNDLLIYGSQKIASDRCVLHRQLELSEVFIVDSGEAEMSYSVATKAKSFVVQCKDMQEKRDWMSGFSVCFAEMEKSVLYGWGAKASGQPSPRRDSSLQAIALWMVREGNMVRENYLLPDLARRTYGFLHFNHLRLIVDPQAHDKVGITQQMLGLLKRGGMGLFNPKVGPEAPIPCEQVSAGQLGNAVDMLENGSVSSCSSPGVSKRRNLPTPDSSLNQADLLGLDTASLQTRSLPHKSISQSSTASSTASVHSLCAEDNPISQRPVSIKGPPKPAKVQLHLLLQAPQYRAHNPLHKHEEVEEEREAGDEQQAPFHEEEHPSSQQQQQHTVHPQTYPESPLALQQQPALHTCPIYRDCRNGRPPSLDGSKGLPSREQVQMSLEPATSQQQLPFPSARSSSINNGLPFGQVSSPDPFATAAALADEISAATIVPSSTTTIEYVAVIPVTDMGLGLFLKDEGGQVVIGGFRSPRTGVGTNPSQRAGVKLGDILVRVNGIPVGTVAQTIAALRESRMEQVIALTLRKGDAHFASQAGSQSTAAPSTYPVKKLSGKSLEGNAKVFGRSHQHPPQALVAST